MEHFLHGEKRFKDREQSIFERMEEMLDDEKTRNTFDTTFKHLDAAVEQ